MSRRAILGQFATVLGLFALSSSVQAQVQFSFNFTDAAGIGFNAAGQTGADRRAGLAQAANYISSVLGPTYTATIFLDVNGSVTNDTTLASASSNFNSTFSGNGFGLRGDVMTKILGGADPNALQADGVINWNFEDFNWEPLSDFQPGELDLISTAEHELTHAIGFAAFIAQNGNSPFGDPAGTASEWTSYAQFVADANGVSIIDSNGVLDGARWNTASVGGSGPTGMGLQFNGANAIAAAGGPVYLYSPTTYSPGSTASHLDTDYYTGMNGTIENMMNHASSIPEGLDIRTYTAIELGILKDIGYTRIGVAAVPEPGSIALFVGMATVGVSVLRKRRKQSA